MVHIFHIVRYESMRNHVLPVGQVLLYGERKKKRVKNNERMEKQENVEW